MRFLACLLLTVSCFGANSSAIREPRALAFEARKTEYLSHGPGYALSVTSRGAVLSLRGVAVRMSISGSNPKASLVALDPMLGRANYFLGRDVRASYDLYGRVRWRAVYPGIDLVFRGNQEHLEYDFEIQAGRDPGRIKVGFEGIGDMRVDPDGDLVLSAGDIEIHQPKPVAYQLVAGRRRPVDVDYRIDAAGHVRFRTGAYDRARPLVIDPQIVFDKTFGGSGVSAAAGLARDAQGNLYVTGSTNSTDFATVNPAQSQLGTAPLLDTANAGQTWSYPLLPGATSVNAIAAAPSTPTTVYAATPVGVFKSADGGTTWAAAPNTGFAGQPTALTVDANSATTLYAATAQGVFVSTDGASTWQVSTSGLTGTGILVLIAHPTQAGTVFASIQNPPGVFRSTNFGQTWTQLTLSPPDFQLTAPINTIVFGSNGSIVAATYQGLLISTDGGNTWTASGANQGVQNNQALAIAPNSPNTLYLVNSTSSGLQVSTDGGKTFSSVISSVHFTNLARIAVDPRNPGTVYVTDYNLLYRSTDGGQTWPQLALPYSITPQTIFVSPADSRLFLGAFTQNNVFVTKWSADGSQVLYSTYLGGNGSDGARAIAVDASGSAYVTGSTTSPDFPTTPGAYETKLTSTEDIFVAKLSPDGSQLMYSTLLGSQASAAAGIAVDATGNAVITGFTQGNFPVTASASQSAPVMGCYMSASPVVPIIRDAFVTRLAAGGNALVYSTLLGGSCSTNGNSIAVDANGNAWVAGATLSPDFPVTSDALQPKFGGGVYDGFLARLNPSGGLAYATYIGGPGYDSLNAIAFDQSGDIYLTGESGGLTQPASAGAFQAQASASCPSFFIGPSFYTPQGNALVLKLDAAAHSVLGLTYLGAPGCLSPSLIAVDSSGEPWISGTVSPSGATLQTVSPFQIGVGNGFISRFSADFTTLLFSTYFETVSGLALDLSGFAYVAGTGTSNPSGAQPAYVAKIDPTPPAISLDSIVGAVPSASQPGSPAIAPGELIRILGQQMGPVATTSRTITSGVLANNVAGVQVTFDGVAVPLVAVSAQVILLVAPFELASKSVTTVQVQYNGGQSNAVQVAVTPLAVQILGVFNEDFSLNSAANPAQAGSDVILYLAGAGQTNPPSQDGQVNVPPLAAPGMPITIVWFAPDSGLAAQLATTFAGSAPGLAAGILQVNFAAPTGSLSNVYVVVGGVRTAQFNISVQ